mmetsp:Transcript_23469/g.27569  ORF Transcript_23469/g.27569 Transcript_23469/m.27569 type:complete len:95 (+) Transcript_23469:359-643(+)
MGEHARQRTDFLSDKDEADITTANIICMYKDEYSKTYANPYLMPDLTKRNQIIKNIKDLREIGQKIRKKRYDRAHPFTRPDPKTGVRFKKRLER